MDNFDLKKYLGSKTLLKENAPGYDTRKSGEALPTLESVKAAYEAKNKKEIKEGIWNLPTEDEIIEFVAYVENMKDKFYHIGSDDVFNGLDQAIIAAKDLAMNSTYVEDPLNPLGEPGSLNEEYEVGAEVILRGSSTVSDIFTVVGKRRMFGSNLMAYSVEHPNGETMEYDETQLSGVPTTMGDRALRSAQFKDGERMGYED